MSESDSFLNEVTEEVRRDKLVGLLRRNALYIGTAVVVIVGTAAFLEYRKSSAETEAQARGDALWAALESPDPAARLDALSGVDVPGDTGSAFLSLQSAGAALVAEQTDQAIEFLQQASSSPTASSALRDVARLKLVSISGGHLPEQERLDILGQLAVEGHAMRGLALEQRALIQIGAGDLPAAGADLEALLADEQISSDVKQRAGQLLQVLGITPAEDARGDVDASNTVQDG